MIWGNNQFIAVGESGTIVTSTDAIVWNNYQLDTMVEYFDITYGFNKFVVVGCKDSMYFDTSYQTYYHSDSTIIRSSQDGITWTNRLSATNMLGYIYSITCGMSGFVVVSNGGELFSPDGINWTSQSITGVKKVIWGKNLFIAVGTTLQCGYFQDFPPTCWYNYSFLSSPDGKNWTTPSSSPELRSVTWCNNEFFGFTEDSSKILASSDGATWTTNSTNSICPLRDIAWGNNLYVAVGDTGTILTSPDGVTWTTKNFGLTKDDMHTVVWNGNDFVITAIRASKEPGAYSPTFYYTDCFFSPNVKGWALQYGSNSAANTSNICWGLNQFVAVCTDGKIMTSTDGINWTQQTSGTTAPLNSVTWNGNQFVAVGYGVVLTSPDAVNWTNQPIDSSLRLYDIAWGGNTFVAVGGHNYSFNDKIFTSPDGITWTAQIADTSELLNGITYGDSQFVIVGNSGKILASPDGINWRNRSSGMTKDLTRVIYGNGYFVAIGSKGAIIISPDGKLWTTKIANVSVTLGSIAFSGTLFVVVGGNVILTSPTDPNSIFHQPGQSLFSQNQFFHISNKTIHYFLLQPSDVSINLYSLQGRLAKTLLSARKTGGAYTLRIPSSLAQGKYILSFRAGHIKIDRAVFIAR